MALSSTHVPVFLAPILQSGKNSLRGLSSAGRSNGSD
jgi:hypothetical protein